MKILILGVEGMLGHELYKSLVGNYDLTGFVKSVESALLHKDLFTEKKLISDFDIENKESLRNLILKTSPDVVINAVGFIKQKSSETSAISSVKLNALLPLELSSLSGELGFKLICFSTDCIFSGKKGMYSERDIPDPVDEYGITKLVGEKIGNNCLVLRTSFYGLELNSNYGLIEWFLNQKNSIKGYSNAIYTGLPTYEIANIIKKIIDEFPSLSGLWNVSSDPIDKFSLLSLLNTNLGNKIEVLPDDKFSIDRSLDSTRFRNFLDYHPPTWEEAVSNLATEIKKRETYE